MSMVGRTLVADPFARLLQRRPGPRLPHRLSFAELPARTETVTIPTRHGDIRAVVYWPEAGDGLVPVYVNFHGGGFVVRHPEQDDPLCRYLAAAAARLALEQGGPAIALQVLHYAVLDLATSPRDKRVPGQRVTTVALERLFDAVYFPSPEASRDRLASPAWGVNADGIGGIAPALVITCEVDRLHDEGVAYAGKLAAVGALDGHLDLPGTGHGYNLYVKDRALVENSYARIAKHVIAATSG